MHGQHSPRTHHKVFTLQLGDGHIHKSLGIGLVEALGVPGLKALEIGKLNLVTVAAFQQQMHGIAARATAHQLCGSQPRMPDGRLWANSSV